MRAFWLASEAYIWEARRSAESLKRHMPDVETWLFSPDPVADDRDGTDPVVGFDRSVVLSERQGLWFSDSIRYWVEAMGHFPDDAQVLYLDTDTHVCGPFYDLFDLLEKFDFVATHAPGRFTSKTVEALPDAFPEFNIGVNVFRLSVRTRHLFADWLARYEAHRGVYGNNDQAPLREALWNSAARLYVMPQEYNSRWRFGGFARYPIRVLHGRPSVRQGNYAEVERQLNRSEGMRSWAPSPSD